MDGIFIAKHFRLGTPARLDIFFLEHENRTRRTAADSDTDVIYPEVSRCEQTQRRELFRF